MAEEKPKEHEHEHELKHEGKTITLKKRYFVGSWCLCTFGPACRKCIYRRIWNHEAFRLCCQNTGNAGSASATSSTSTININIFSDSSLFPALGPTSAKPVVELRTSTAHTVLWLQDCLVSQSSIQLKYHTLELQLS